MTWHANFGHNDKGTDLIHMTKEIGWGGEEYDTRGSM